MYSVTEHETDIIGLKYRPSIAPEYDDNDEQVVEFYNTLNLPYHFTELNEQVLRDLMVEIRPKVILEIGVYRPVNENEASSTKILAAEKLDDAVYIGIDTDSKLEVRLWGKKIYTIQGNSRDRTPVYELMEKLELPSIDLLFIDGNHSVTAILNDWIYVERLSDNGVVAIHDTNVHPGPYTIFDAVDEKMFDKKKYGVEEQDWGIGVLKKI